MSLKVSDVYSKIAFMQDHSFNLVSILLKNDLDLKNGNIKNQYQKIYEQLLSNGNFCKKFARQNNFLDNCLNTNIFEKIKQEINLFQIYLEQADFENDQEQVEKFKNNFLNLRKDIYLFLDSFSNALQKRVNSTQGLIFTEVKHKIVSKKLNIPPKLNIKNNLNWKEQLSFLKKKLIFEKQCFNNKKIVKEIIVNNITEANEEETYEIIDKEIKEKLDIFSIHKKKANLQVDKFRKKRKNLYGISKFPILIKKYGIQDHLELFNKFKYKIFPFIENYYIIDDIKFVWVFKKFSKKLKLSPQKTLQQVLTQRNNKIHTYRYMIAGDIFENKLYYFIPILQEKIILKSIFLNKWTFNFD